MDTHRRGGVAHGRDVDPARFLHGRDRPVAVARHARRHRRVEDVTAGGDGLSDLPVDEPGPGPAEQRPMRGMGPGGGGVGHSRD